MYRPDIRKTKSGVPVLSKKEIDVIGEKLVEEFEPQALKSPQEIDIDLFIQDYLGMEQDFQYLSHCGLYLGMIVFNETDRIPVYDPQSDCAEYISAKAHTVIVDRSLLEENQEHRYRFTVGHEAGHELLHGEYFAHGRRAPCCNAPGEALAPMIQCRIDAQKTDTQKSKRWTDHEWMEWQANALSSAILMPASMVRAVVSDIKKRRTTETVFSDTAIAYVAAVFNVSFEAACNRLKQLGHIPQTAFFDSYILNLILSRL